MKTLTILFSLFSVLALAQTDSLSQEVDCEVVLVLVSEMPDYPGGSYALSSAVNEIVRKVPCKASGAKSLVFVINREGKMKSPVFQPGNLSACSSILEKEFEELETWLPGKQAGKPVCVQFTILLK